MSRAVITWIGLTISVLLPRARAAEADALAISANIQALHVPFGTILDPIYESGSSNQIIGYTRCGDSALLTGHYLAAEAFRYRVTQSADALNNVKQAVAAINSLIQVTGTNLLARCLVPLNSPYAAGIQSEEAANGIHTNSSAGYFWVGNTSRDQYLGVAFGLAVAYDMVNDPGVQNSISQIAWLLIGFLTGHGWSVVMPDGSVSTTFLVRPDQMLTLLQIGRHVNPDKFSTDYDVNRILLLASVLAPITVDVTSDGSYFKFNLDYISFYNLIRLESSPAQAVYQGAYDELRGGTRGDQNAMFDIIDRALKGPNAARDAEALALTNAWLQRSRRDFSVNWQNQFAMCGSAACNPIPVVLRPPDEYLWQESPYQLSGGGSGRVETAAIDYLLPYWMGRYYGVIPAIEVHSAAAPNAAITPDSLASIYGSNLAAAAQSAASLPLPLSLGGSTVTITDSAGVSRPAPLLYVSPAQINFAVPAGVAAGTAQVSIGNGGAVPIATTATIQSIAPALFSMSGDGKGVAAAYAVQTTANSSSQTLLAVFECSASVCNSAPIALNAQSSTTLVLYGTGIRNRSSLANVTANVGGANVAVRYAGLQPTYEGLDQLNIDLPIALSGSGDVNVFVVVDGQTSNVVTIRIQ